MLADTILSRFNSSSTSLKVALAHDWLVGLRGGEWVLDRLARLFGPTDIYTLVKSGEAITDAIESCRVISSQMQQWPGAAGSLRRWYLPFYPYAVESLVVGQEYDILFSTSSAMIKSIKVPINSNTGKKIPHLCYCHSPARYIWDMASEYSFGNGGFIRYAGLTIAGHFLRYYDRITSDRVTTFIANSTHTADRIKRYYDREAQVIFPPVRTEYFKVGDEFTRSRDYYLVVSALEPYKRVDIAVRAALECGFRLKIVGDGSQSNYLRELAGKSVDNNIDFLGWCGHAQLRDIYANARALLFPGIEDFGIVPIEAMACGCPVIAMRAGGALDWFRDMAGEAFCELTVNGLLEAIRRFENRINGIKPEDCRENAIRFSESRFDKQILDLVYKTLE